MAEEKEWATPSRRTLDDVKKSLAAAQRELKSARGTLEEASGDGGGISLRAVAARAGDYLEQAKEHLGEAKDFTQEVAARSRKQAEALYAESSEQYLELVARVRELSKTARNTLRDAADRVADLEVWNRRDEALEFLRSKPVGSVLMALAVGFVVGYLIHSRD